MRNYISSMAYYINDEKLLNVANTTIGIQMIFDFIKSNSDQVPIIEQTKEGTILIQLRIRDSKGILSDKMLTNIVGISYSQVYVNPFIIKGEIATKELYDYIISTLSSLSRENNLNILLGESLN